MSTELKIWCTNKYQPRYNRLQILRVSDGKNALWLDKEQVRSVVTDDNPPATDDFKKLGFALVRNNDKPQWFWWSGEEWSPLEEEAALGRLYNNDVAEVVLEDEGLRKLVVKTIAYDHAQQIMGSYILRNFIKGLEKLFSRANLYLFELLQNAVDDGAKRLSFVISDNKLIFQHDGKEFNAGDVLGLSAVGASGKSGRTIGFMGLGFKSVYSRFDHVGVFDKEWSFCYDRPDNTNDGQWKFLPKWCDSTPPEGGFNCRFDFSRVRISESNEGEKLIEYGTLLEDFKKIETAVPVLLARRSLRTKSDTWELNWNGQITRVGRETDELPYVEYFHSDDSEKQRRWFFFLSTRWAPSAEAVKCWQDYREDSSDPGEQELVLFTEIDEQGNFINGQTIGKCYAVLPTEETLPLGFNLQANWVLNAERTHPKSARDNAWNADVISQLPNLIIRLLQWIANRKGSWEIQEVYRRLPTFQMNNGKPILTLLEKEVDFSTVIEALCTEPLTPVLDSPEPQIGDLLTSDPSEDEQKTSSSPTQSGRLIAHRLVVRPDQCTYKFVKVDECRSVPDAFLADLAPHFIRRWLGGFYPFAFSTKDPAGKDPAGQFFYSMEILREPSDKEWESTIDNYQKILQLLPENVRAWVVIHVVAATLRSKSQQYAPSISLSILPNGHWKLCAINTLNPAAYQYYGSLEKDVREILVLDPQKTPALALMLALIRIPENSVVKHEVDAFAVVKMLWPNGYGQLRDITEPFFKKEAEDNREDMIHRVVAVTTALRKLRVNDAVTHVLATKDGKLGLFPKNEVWVGAAYGFSHIEQAAAGEISIVAPDYGDDSGAWKKFFISECQTSLLPRWKIVKEDDFYKIGEYIEKPTTLNIKNKSKPQDLPLNLDPENIYKDKTFIKIYIFETTIGPWDEILKNGNFDHARACAFAKVLALGEYSKTDHSETKGTGTHNYEFFPTKTYVSWIITDKRRAYVELSTASNHQCQNWIELLRDKAWVPTKGEGVVKPKDVLLWPDQDNPDAPVADLDDATRKGLEPLREAVNFGKDVRQYGPLDRLINAVKHSETSNEILVDLWREILNDTQLDVERLKKNARKHDLIPVKNPCCDGKTRIGSTRLLSGNSSQGQFDFKGFLVAVADTLLADLATKLVEILEIPERTTADQATDYLEWVWSAVAQQNAFHVQKQVVSAWRIVADEPSVWPKIKAIREGGKMQLFCRQPGVYHGKWLPLPSTNPEPVWNDAPEKAACLRDNDSICLEAWIFKKKDINVNNLIELLGISRLSDGQRFSLNVDIYGNKSSLSEQTQRLRLITKAIINAHGQDEEEDELSTTELTLYSVQSISRTFSIDGREPNEDNLDARWDGDKSMYVVGDRSVTWATDLRPLVQQALRLGGNARGLRFLDLLPLLDDDKTFNRKYEQLCRELGVPEFEMEPNTKVENPNKTVKPTTPEEIINLRQVESPPPLPPVPPPNLNEPEGKGEDVERIDKRRWFNRIKTIVDPAISRFMGRVKQAPNRFLIDGPRSEEEEEEKLACESKLSKDDTDARQKVFEYEQGEGRTPTIATRNQAGYDVSSVDDSSGHERKIEVKGLQGTWENDATVTMTGRQFDDARMKEGDWWLYVVDNIGTDHPCVIRIYNPAKGTRRFYLYACHWRDKAETEPSEPLVGPDDGDE